MPWTYGPEGVRIVRDLFRLRYQLLPYIYTMTRRVHEEALPLVRPLYIMHPHVEEAYRHPDEYYFGDAMLVAPVVDSSGVRDVYLPPGEWVEYFSGLRRSGNTTLRVASSLETFPLFIRAGSIIPRQPDMAYTDQKPLDSLIVDIYAPGNAGFTLYEDDGQSLDYERGKYARTPIVWEELGTTGKVTIGPSEGTFAGQPGRRSYCVRLTGRTKPGSVAINGVKIAANGGGVSSWRWDARRQQLSISVGRKSIRAKTEITIRD
jgi:alpha-glucosidase (family GH31 glycosyl hydrolase)